MTCRSCQYLVPQGQLYASHNHERSSLSSLCLWRGRPQPTGAVQSYTQPQAQSDTAAPRPPSKYRKAIRPSAVNPTRPAARQDGPVDWNPDYYKAQPPLKLYLQRVDGKIGCVFNANAQNDGQTGKKRKGAVKAKARAHARAQESLGIFEWESSPRRLSWTRNYACPSRSIYFHL